MPVDSARRKWWSRRRRWWRRRRGKLKRGGEGTTMSKRQRFEEERKRKRGCTDLKKATKMATTKPANDTQSKRNFGEKKRMMLFWAFTCGQRCFHFSSFTFHFLSLSFSLSYFLSSGTHLFITAASVFSLPARAKTFVFCSLFLLTFTCVCSLSIFDSWNGSSVF